MSQREELKGVFSAQNNWKKNVDADFVSDWNERKQQESEQLDFQKKMLMEAQRKQEELWEGKEIMPFGFNIMIKPSDKNPYVSKISDSGIITDSGGLFSNPDTGQSDIAELGICYAIVEQVGPDVKHVRKGDEIIYMASRLLPLPFKGIGYCLLNEGHVLGIINNANTLEERFKNVNYGG